MNQSTSNIRVFPSFPETAFFSGEEFSCILTFKNVASSLPSPSSASLTPLEGLKNGSRIENSKVIGAEWMSERGRSASEGPPMSPGVERSSEHSRSLSTSGRNQVKRKETASGSSNSHTRSQSVVSPNSADTEVNFENLDPFDEKQDTGTDMVPLSIDTNVKATPLLVSPEMSHSSSPLPQINKLDLHSTIEDDASSETSSVGPSKPQFPLQTNVFTNFSPRSSLDIRDPETDVHPALRRANQARRLARSPLSQISTDMRSQADTLMMGYAQVVGSFMIDEALIHANEFDEIKSKGIIGGKSGGGVVGIDSRRTTSWTGLGSLGTFGLGSLFTVTQPSSLAEMRDRATSKTIPILSTPPSILFVDIRLQPGESRSFSYNFKLPRNLPPSHRGRALRISYSLVITTQRPGTSGQYLSTAEIPFRLFSHLDGFTYPGTSLTLEHGHQPQYDLKRPIILLRDEAKTSSLKDTDEPPPLPTKRPRHIRRSSTYSDKPIESSQEEFMVFVDHLFESLGKAPVSATDPLLRADVPMTPATPSRTRFRPLSVRETIDFVVQRGFAPITGTKAKIGVFEIGKNGVTIATLTLPRTVYKLGDTIDGVIDLEDGIVNCFQIRSTLESAEDIDAEVSVRSPTSVYRATRRVHSSKLDFTAFARRVTFAFEIPTGVAPSFETSYVRHHWSLRLEFITSPIPGSDTDDTGSSEPPDLLQMVEKDDRAIIYSAVETLSCESFDCHVPVMVLPTNQEIPEDRVGLAGFVV